MIVVKYSDVQHAKTYIMQDVCLSFVLTIQYFALIKGWQ